MGNLNRKLADTYMSLLEKYIKSQDKDSLNDAKLVAKSFLKNEIYPDELVSLHLKLQLKNRSEYSEEMLYSMRFLLEAMISYGAAFEEVIKMREEQITLQSEMAVAAKMQQTLLQMKKPMIDGVEIGVISIPAQQLNGDYYYLVEHADGVIGLALADVIGKGVPAALCMSMIKYSLESFPERVMQPKMILQSLNRVVERHVESNMFITMVYANYDPKTNMLTYAFAGHEPGFYYSARQNQFTEIRTKGLVLGALKEVEYEEQKIKMDKDDFVIFLTDGVTECREGERFIEVFEVLDVIRLYLHLPAQEMVEKVYDHFAKNQQFQLKDDFSLLILRRNV